MSAIQATSAGVKDMADGSLRITLEFDPAYAKEAYALFGARGTPLAVAALNLQASQAQAQQETIEEAKGGFLSQWLAMRCNEPKFWEFIECEIAENTTTCSNKQEADVLVKMALDIDSKRELDNDKEAEQRFHEIIRKPYAEWLVGKR